MSRATGVPRNLPEGPGVERIAELATALSSPVRVRILTHLLREGPTGFGELSLTLGLGASLLSNHLSRLREHRLVDVERAGRNATYRLSSPQLHAMLQALYETIGDPLEAVKPPATETVEAWPATALVHARSCYDHLAGRLGVTVYRWLLTREAVVFDEKSTGDLVLGDGAEETLITLGIGLTALPPGRRRFAFACPDWTQGDDHLGGAFGAALLASFLDRRWLTRIPGSRALQITQGGRTELEPLLAMPERRED